MGATAEPTLGTHVPPSVQQAPKLARYQLREYLRSRRFVALAGIILGIGAVITAVLGYYRGPLVHDKVSFFGTFFGGGIDIVIVLAAVFFGGDAIAGEFQNKTGYFLMGLPVRRGTVYVGKFIAAYLAAVAMLLLFLAVLVGNALFYFGGQAIPWQLVPSLGLALLYLAAVMGATFLFSSLFKTSAYGFVLTAILFLFGFTLLQDLVYGLAHVEPWMVISYAESTIGGVFAGSVNWGFQHTVAGNMFTGYADVAGIGEGADIMLAYLLLTAVGGFFRFEREEFN